mmetsp:Transcript_20063/g.36263  ORF Transcript_20063/g.36263 Transcript_20063/m.36263 type:complete len:137 (+) Transcript_20063:85-495(+)
MGDLKRTSKPLPAGFREELDATKDPSFTLMMKNRAGEFDPNSTTFAGVLSANHMAIDADTAALAIQVVDIDSIQMSFGCDAIGNRALFETRMAEAYAAGMEWFIEDAANRIVTCSLMTESVRPVFTRFGPAPRRAG